MKKKAFTRTDYLLWTIIVVYTGVIYATLAIVTVIRKSLEERFGSGMYDALYWVMGILAVVIAAYLLRTLRGRRLTAGIANLSIIGIVYWYNLTTMEYAVEKVHFLEYGLLGALLYIALQRHCAQVISMLLAAIIVYWIGLGDEAIQWALPGRVGEIRDSLINLFSGVLGIAALHFTVYAYRPSRPVSGRQLRSLPAAGAITVVLTAVFIMRVHGFGHILETTDTGRIYSHFKMYELLEMNAAGFPSPRARAIYENEALRHLHQREFYVTNDYKARDGTVYRMYDMAAFENRVLEVYYSRFLDERADMFSGQLLAALDPDVASKSMRRPVRWPDSLARWVGEQAGESTAFYESRVKSALFTSFSVRDLIFYSALTLLLMIYFYCGISYAVL